MSEALAEAVREILQRVPCSDRALARAADVPPSAISRIRTGDRGCSPEVAASLVGALEEWSEDCSEAADHLRRELQREGATDE